MMRAQGSWVRGRGFIRNDVPGKVSLPDARDSTVTKKALFARTSAILMTGLSLFIRGGQSGGLGLGGKVFPSRVLRRD